MKSKIMKKILFIFEIRPEAIKLAPLIKEFKKHNSPFTVHGSQFTAYNILNIEHWIKLCT